MANKPPRKTTPPACPERTGRQIHGQEPRCRAAVTGQVYEREIRCRTGILDAETANQQLELPVRPLKPQKHQIEHRIQHGAREVEVLVKDKDESGKEMLVVLMKRESGVRNDEGQNQQQDRPDKGPDVPIVRARPPEERADQEKCAKRQEGVSEPIKIEIFHRSRAIAVQRTGS